MYRFNGLPFKSHVKVAARIVAFSSPTPYAFNMACAANAATIDEQNAWRQKHTKLKYNQAGVPVVGRE